jgi:Glycosyl hydrolase family 12
MRAAKLKARLSAVSVVAMSAAGLSAAVAPAAMAAGCPSGQTAWMTVKQANNVQGVLMSDNWGGGTACETNAGGTANFTVSQPAASYSSRNVLAYPDIEVGCLGGYCSTASGLPAAESSITPLVNWSTTNSPQPGSRFDTGIDSWFASSASQGAKPAPTGEVMVLINSSGFSGLGLPSSGTQVSIDGYEWYVTYSPAGSRGWPYTTYALAQGSVVDSVTDLNMANFYADAMANGNLPAGQYLTDIGAGNEIWAGGVGLGTTSLLISGL